MTDEHAKNLSCLVTLAIWVGIGLAAWWVGFTLFSTLVLSISIVFVAWLLGKKSPAGLLNELLTMTVLARWVYLVLLLCLLVSCASMFKPSMHLPFQRWQLAQQELVADMMLAIPATFLGREGSAAFLKALPSAMFWPILIGCPFYILSRLLRPKRFGYFLKARRLYEKYRDKHIPQTPAPPRNTFPTSSMQQHAASDRRLKKALCLLQKALQLSQKENESYDVAVSEYHIGLISFLQGQFESATACFERCLALSSTVRQDINMQNTLAACRDYIAEIKRRTGI